jgi:hypothetical protein
VRGRAAGAARWLAGWLAGKAPRLSQAASAPQFYPAEAHCLGQLIAYTKNTDVFSKIKNRYFCLFFRANLTVLGVLVGSAGE